MGSTKAIVAYNRRRSEEMAARVGKEIERMIANKEYIEPTGFAKRMNVSWSYLYTSDRVKNQFRRALALQREQEYVPAKKVALDRAMETMIEVQKKSLEGKNMELNALRAENEKLKKALAKKDLKSLF